jgi:1-deoxy-D-xylulose-5-phosphate synthase
VGNDGATHHGLLDLAYLRHIPNMVIGAPMTAEDLKQMMILAEDYNGPIAIRYPRGRTERPTPTPSLKGREMIFDAQVAYGKGAKLRDGKDLAVITIGAIGNTMAEAIEMAESGKSRGGEPPQARRSQEGVSIAHYDMRWLKPLDEEMLHEIGKKYSTIVTAEDGILAGGMGSAVLEWMNDHNYHPHIIRLGVDDQFVEHGSTKELYHLLNLDKEGLCESLLQALEK